ncbi:hypothetical protein LZ31DRAFT_357634 [Colletotrichum somersetense]|nr:hypothetical protein LZ31DRAFT_357634 [Colletotrichum somersetense]
MILNEFRRDAKNPKTARNITLMSYTTNMPYTTNMRRLTVDKTNVVLPDEDVDSDLDTASQDSDDDIDGRGDSESEDDSDDEGDSAEAQAAAQERKKHAGTFSTTKMVFRLPYAMEFNVLVMDEGHAVKNPQSLSFQIVEKFDVNVSWIVTATEIQYPELSGAGEPPWKQKYRAPGESGLRKDMATFTKCEPVPFQYYRALGAPDFTTRAATTRTEHGARPDVESTDKRRNS